MNLYITLIENLHNRIDDYLPYIIQSAVGQLLNLKLNAQLNYQSMCLQVVCMCFWYNTGLTFSVLEQN